MEDLDLIFPFVIARSNESCDVAIKAKSRNFATLDSHAIAQNDKRGGNTRTRFAFATLDSYVASRL